MSSPCFRFKQFTVYHDRCAMKVGTDGVLIGSWCTIPPVCHNILDIGTGSGLIALMLAQRCKDAVIHGIDIDENAVAQAQSNFQTSPWAERLTASLSPVQKWEGKYDLIVSNPPFFINSLKNPDKGRQTARHTDTLSYRDLIAHSARLLSDNGQLALILPAEAEQDMLQYAAQQQLFPTRLTQVYSKPGRTNPVRILASMVKSPATIVPIVTNSLYIESTYSSRSEEYVELTKDFYL